MLKIILAASFLWIGLVQTATTLRGFTTLQDENSQPQEKSFIVSLDKRGSSIKNRYTAFKAEELPEQFFEGARG